MPGQVPVIIGVSGKAGSGKTTFANFLKDEFKNRSISACVINYADLVKFISKEYFGWNGEKDEWGRTLIQTVGTEFGRNKTDINIWVDLVIQCVSVLKNAYDVMIIGDCRFPNEIERWSEKGQDMISIRIDRTNYDTVLTKAQQAHASETALDDYGSFDYHVENSGSLKEFADAAKAIAKDIIWN